MAQVQFGGSWYQTIKQAAAAWAATALPDTGVIEPGEVARDAAQNLEAYWAGEAEKIGDIAPEGVDEAEWRAACVDAIEERILDARGLAADARAAEAHQDQADESDQPAKTTIDIGTLDGNSLTLTHEATVACGHMLPEGVDGGDAARYHRREARLNAQRQADKLGKSVEIFASAPDAQDWVVDVVEPQGDA